MPARAVTTNSNDFNSALIEAFEESIREILGPAVLESLYRGLEKRYDARKDEIPYRLETAFGLLSNIFGLQGSHTLSRQIARRLYKKLGLPPGEIEGYTLMESIEAAKRMLAAGTPQ